MTDKSSHTATLFGVVVIAVLVILAVTNPDKASFEDALDSAVAGSSTSMFDRISGQALAELHKFNVVYKNYVFVSVVETSIGSESSTYLGVLGNWIRIS